MSITEQTPLIHEGTSLHLFESTLIGTRQRRIRKLQCFLWTILISIGAFIIIFTMSYGLSIDSESDQDNSEDLMMFNDTNFLFQTSWPILELLDDKNCTKYVMKWKNFNDFSKFVDPTSSSYKHQKSFVSSDFSRNLSKIAYVQEYKNRNNLQCKIHKLELNLPKCNQSDRYRTYNGTCNNLKHPKSYGAAFTAFLRLLTPEYEDGISEPRKNLPSARTVSITVHRPMYKDDEKFTVMLAVWGQFIDHDITATALYQHKSKKPISCCMKNRNPECFPVLVNISDPYYGKYNVTCLEFVRSAPAPKSTIGPREQFTQVSAFIDGSVIYGGDEETALRLRTLIKGTLKMYITENGRSLLPISTDLNDGCNREEEIAKGRYCFMTGDSRSNENLHLISMHLIWVRQHNRIAFELTELNPKWNDERIFQESRRIIGAQLQHITYNEFLPIILGQKLMKQSRIFPQNWGYYDGYDEKIDATIANNFATAAFRFGHTLIPGLVKLLRKNDSKAEYVRLHKYLFNPFDLYTDGPDSNIHGAINSTLGSRPLFTPEVQHHLFENTVNGSKTCGLDLVSLNIQRGRDHGLPGYTKWRSYCNLSSSNNFDDFRGEIDNESLDRMRSIYGNMNEVDLYTGAVSEKPLKGGILGATLSCLILDQFVRLKNGDRFWYENSSSGRAFTSTQLHQLRMTSLAGIICDNADDVNHVQPHVMLPVGEGNEYAPCSEIPRPDLTKWKDADLPRVFISDSSISVKSMKFNDSG